MKNIVTIGGDGIGPEVVGVTKEVLQTLFPDTFAFTDISAGYDHFLETGETISEADLQLCREADAVLYGANTNPAGDSKYSSLTLTLRQELGLYANVRPAKSLPGIGRYENVDLVVVRENSEGMYIREEERIPHGWVAKRRITEGGCERILTYAFELALTLRKSRVTLVHKANVLRHTCGLFRKIGFELAAEYPDLTVDERFVDAMAMELVMRPEEFQVIVTTNLFGDILSDEASGLV
ncbi:MAG: isocitrate/isopropylmalate dehydrogenase family protein, partial [Bdellovibrionales bacterium]|nr:isocitrate/isopropylmalate dehydrogenase family protein [Bdellovibrionales bacterium]